MISNSKMFSWLVVGKIIAYLRLFSKSSMQVFSVAHFIKTPTENRSFLQIFFYFSQVDCTECTRMYFIEKNSTKNLCVYDKECFCKDFQF